MNNKPRILLCWGYYRKGWVEVFERLKHDFEFHFLFWLSKELERDIYTDCPRHYWEDFASGQDVLDKIKPEKVVLMGVNNLVSVALQFACTRKKIKTYFLQHGLFHTLKTTVYVQEEMEKNRIGTKVFSQTKEIYRWRFQQLSFLIRSLSAKEIRHIPKLLKWQWDERRMRHIAALANNHSTFRQADQYIVFTKFNAAYISELDGIGEEKMIPVGVPEFDKFFDRFLSHTVKNKEYDYNLLIDSALTFNEVFKSKGIIKQEVFNNFLSKLNEISFSNGKKLVVKLHPFSYQNQQFLQHPNIVYIQEGDMVELLLDAHHVFGFDSTLMLIALYLKPTILFSIHDFGYLQYHVNEMKAAPVLQFNAFTMLQLEKAMLFKASDEAKEQLREKFLYATDGKTHKRISSVFAN